jgi:hypothetical protein
MTTLWLTYDYHPLQLPCGYPTLLDAKMATIPYIIYHYGYTILHLQYGYPAILLPCYGYPILRCLHATATLPYHPVYCNSLAILAILLEKHPASTPLPS